MRLVFACLLLFVWGGEAARANEDPDSEVARRHFNLGRAYYDSADYPRALDEFQQAKRARPHPALDYNIGRCLDRLERWPEAIRAYEAYAAGNPPDGAEIRARIDQLKERVQSFPNPTPLVKETVLLAPPPESLIQTPPPKKKHTLAIVLGVVGGAVVIGAAVAIGLLVKTTTDPAWPDNTGGPHPATP